MMINRVIFNENTYYKVNDLQELYNVSMYKIKKAIKEQGIVIGTLKGFGRTLFILEAELNMLEIDGAVTYMKTAVKDYREEMISNGRMAGLAYSLFGMQKTNEELIQEASQKAIDKVDELNSTELTLTTERDKEQIEQIRDFNQLAKEFGYANRFHNINLIVNGKLTNVILHTINGTICDTDDFYTIDIPFEHYEAEFERGIFEDSYDTEFVLTPGESDTTDEEAFIALLHKIKNENCHIINHRSGTDELVDDNEMCFMKVPYHKEAEIYVALLKADYKFVHRARQF
ncbi:hypothetical protein [Bacillus pseudomycoides]|uniref:hypothetical protein n=1 Tax=Bacillus pseudomycoides TaxID=64104 RepID=UPI000BF2EB66|nr:hypothetical protein [Bacillus pseudomycoides]PFW95196.1 hypothetical protein COL29_09950 [Bacillus pseudomycoides]